ncbi:uncharacterized protein CXQ87_001982 [Candidozyma duobushaemuli]|uniref:Uncharacterized protein n=1 Tax=Candidozyma duobushaemuli TaxID=1231522 RepID=A0A2V1A8V6_9ASCO|nr:uncharacterized protein CXQ87_001982 [[Candida] duobushaemulonis]PVH13864.1 hypothetical protein CXQ87_001982 [[Candida] duobushaemulonis]
MSTEGNPDVTGTLINQTAPRQGSQRLSYCVMQSLLFIRRADRQYEVEKVVSDMLANDPSRYIGHNIATAFIGGAAWTVTDVKVQNLPTSDESEDQLDYAYK